MLENWFLKKKGWVFLKEKFYKRKIYSVKSSNFEEIVQKKVPFRGGGELRILKGWALKFGRGPWGNFCGKGIGEVGPEGGHPENMSDFGLGGGRPPCPPPHSGKPWKKAENFLLGPFRTHFAQMWTSILFLQNRFCHSKHLYRPFKRKSRESLWLKVSSELDGQDRRTYSYG